MTALTSKASRTYHGTGCIVGVSRVQWERSREQSAKCSIDNVVRGSFSLRSPPFQQKQVSDLKRCSCCGNMEAVNSMLYLAVKTRLLAYTFQSRDSAPAICHTSNTCLAKMYLTVNLSYALLTTMYHTSLLGHTALSKRLWVQN